jgi:hypothetical protein
MMQRIVDLLGYGNPPVPEYERSEQLDHFEHLTDELEQRERHVTQQRLQAQGRAQVDWTRE